MWKHGRTHNSLPALGQSHGGIKLSFRINNNISAMGALRNLNSTQEAFSTSVQRLSTGLRINNAADDPAGLIASEKFRSQIGGLDQAIKNSQDGINFSKTAEGALGEMNKLLNDARTLAVASANSATLSSAQVAANQQQLTSIATSLTRISTNTAFGSKKLLDGSAGTTSAVTNSSTVASLSIGGTFNGATLSSNSTVTLATVTAGTQATTSATATFTALTSTVANAGSFTLNGVSFSATTSTTAQDIINNVNAASSQTGVTAAFTGSGISFSSTSYGSAAKLNLTDANGVVLSSAGSASTAGTNASATVTVGGTTVNFTGGQNGNDGLTLSDADGNNLKLTVNGNVTSATAAAVGQVVAGSSTFQIGGNAGQTASLSLGNFGASNLGTGAVSGLSMANLDLTSASGATSALSVIDKAIDDVSKARGDIGNFQRNVLESNVRSLGVSKENLTATESSIRDTDVAAEMTNYTKLQILQQAGLSVLGQANSGPQSVLSLLR